MTLAAIALLAQLCNPRSADNGTLYRLEADTIHCLDWNQALCSYVERPCRVGELGVLCYYVPSTCALTAKRGVHIAHGPGPRMREVAR